ncbi:MAG: hypothetical protein AAF628_14535 [Planctomycetota bacterium]
MALGAKTESERRLLSAPGPIVRLAQVDPIDAGFLRAYLLDASRGLRFLAIEGDGCPRSIVGDLDLRGAVLPGLEFRDTEFTGAVSLSNATLPWLDIRDASLVRLDLTDAEIDRSLVLHGTSLGPSAGLPALALVRARVSGLIDLSGSELRTAASGDLVFDGDFLSAGELRMAVVEDGRRDDRAFTCAGAINLNDARVASGWNATGATLEGPLGADRLRAGGSVILKPHRARDVQIRQARIGGSLDVGVAALQCNADGARVDGMIRVGPVGASVAGLDERAGDCGALAMNGVHCRQDVGVSGVRLASLGLQKATIDGSLRVDDSTIGKLDLLNASVGSQLVLGEDVNQGGATELMADGLAVGGDGEVKARFVVCSLVGASFGRDLTLHGTFSEVIAKRLKVGAELEWAPRSAMRRVDLSDARVRVLRDDHEIARWPPETQITGFKYDSLWESPSVVKPTRLRFRGSRQRWLEKQPRTRLHGKLIYNPQPTEQLAGVLARQGHEIDARHADVWKQRQRLRSANVGWEERFVLFLWSLVGFGARPVWVLALWFLLTCVGAQFFEQNSMTRANHRAFVMDDAGLSDESGEPIELVYPEFCAWVYSCDVSLPPVDLRKSAFWVPATAWTWRIYYLQTVLGWIFVSVFLISVTRRIRQRT